MSTAKFNQWLNSDGTENYKCRAWVNFNGTGTVAIRASGNVSSITDNGTGDYTVNFTTAMPDANYSFVSQTSGSNSYFLFSSSRIADAKTTTAYRFITARNDVGNLDDPSFVNVAIFR